MLIIALLAGNITAIDTLRCTPENTIIATDIDDVILKRNKTSLFIKVIKHAPAMIKYLKLAKKRNKLTGSHSYDSERIYIDCLKEGDFATARAIRSVAARSKRINKEILLLYQKLHTQGFTFNMATNIGSIFIKDIKQKFPHVFNSSFIQDGMTVDFGSSDIIKKPDLRYFKQLQEIVNPQSDKHIIFIDDKLENVLAARKAGLIAIQFINAQQLTRELALYHIHI